MRRLCAALGPAKVYTELAAILGAEQDLEFAADMVQALNLILLTKPEVRLTIIYLYVCVWLVLCRPTLASIACSAWFMLLMAH